MRSKRRPAPEAKASICAAGRAPDCRPASRPPEKAIIVGMPRMPNEAAACGCISVLTLTSRARPFIAPAALENSGPIVRQGPHQGAQKSTTSGISSVRIAFASVAASSSRALPSTSAAPQVPHFGPASSRSSGTRLVCPQSKQINLTMIGPFFTFIRPDMCPPRHRDNPRRKLRIDFALGLERMRTADPREFELCP